ncbi:hypothetical protein L1987_36109 [Smallanthus sonchifolius]|uniref:Uncharacterized protein n=1 Tax=Smallanthus sonchifolius TaxID=185202 RepID=A0ACB9HEA4_9ASTR|nr:hypothetical protein L1987_36109 [Smallanthus sonchifolius]
MDDEFEESDVIFVQVEASTKRDNFFKFEKPEFSRLKRGRKKKKKKGRRISSVPINIPENKSSVYEDLALETDLFEDDDGSEERIIPPHVIWGRKTMENVAYSIWTRRGETLKIRDFIFKITGFLES